MTPRTACKMSGKHELRAAFLQVHSHAPLAANTIVKYYIYKCLHNYVVQHSVLRSRLF